MGRIQEGGDYTKDEHGDGANASHILLDGRETAILAKLGDLSMELGHR